MNLVEVDSVSDLPVKMYTPGFRLFPLSIAMRKEPFQSPFFQSTRYIR
jgi:hypothetical protein